MPMVESRLDAAFLQEEKPKPGGCSAPGSTPMQAAFHFGAAPECMLCELNPVGIAEDECGLGP
eukprot:14615624-Alexandrium_andersonii.AAC.1